MTLTISLLTLIFLYMIADNFTDQFKIATKLLEENKLNFKNEIQKNTVHSMIIYMLSNNLKSIGANRSSYGLNIHSLEDHTVTYDEKMYSYDLFIVEFKSMARIIITEKSESQEGGFGYEFRGDIYNILCKTVVEDGIERVEMYISDETEFALLS